MVMGYKELATALDAFEGDGLGRRTLFDGERCCAIGAALKTKGYTFSGGFLDAIEITDPNGNRTNDPYGEFREHFGIVGRNVHVVNDSIGFGGENESPEQRLVRLRAWAHERANSEAAEVQS